jgi:hypothetical protein
MRVALKCIYTFKIHTESEFSEAEVRLIEFENSISLYLSSLLDISLLTIPRRIVNKCDLFFFDISEVGRIHRILAALCREL